MRLELMKLHVIQHDTAYETACDTAYDTACNTAKMYMMATFGQTI